jgi:hypothetical protein
MGFEPTTFCMASRRSSQLSYSRTVADSSFAMPFPVSAALGGRYPAMSLSIASLPLPAFSMLLPAPTERGG